MRDKNETRPELCGNFVLLRYSIHPENLIEIWPIWLIFSSKFRMWNIIPIASKQ